MTVESDIYSRIGSLVSNRVYPLTAPIGATLPFITYQQVGGAGVNFLEATAPSKKNGRFQFRVWAATGAAAIALARSLEDSLVTSTTLLATVLGAPVMVYEDDTEYYGTLQDFSIWY